MEVTGHTQLHTLTMRHRNTHSPYIIQNIVGATLILLLALYTVKKKKHTE